MKLTMNSVKYAGRGRVDAMERDRSADFVQS
jgi:hypothetical protein